MPTINLIGSIMFLVIAFMIQGFMIYFNWKQSKVKDKTEIMIRLLTEIRDKL